MTAAGTDRVVTRGAEVDGAGWNAAVARATAAALRFELGEARKRLVRARADEAAELARIDALFEAAGGAGHGLNGDARLACRLGRGRPCSEPALVDALATEAFDGGAVTAALRRLVAAGEARALPAAAGEDRRYELTDRGAARLPERLRRAAMPACRAWVVRLAAPHVAAIVHAARLRLGEGEVALVSGGGAPQLAWRVEAGEPESAIELAIEGLRDVCAQIEVEPREPVVATGVRACDRERAPV